MIGPGDTKYIFKKNNQGNYQIALPRGKYGLSFKITRGNWDNEFTDACGRELFNQDYNYDEIDTLYYAVAGWKDIKKEVNPYVTLVVYKYPKNTPIYDELFLELYSQYEHLTVENYKFEREYNGIYTARIKRKKLQNDYVITRGSYQSQELNAKGQFVAPRKFSFTCDDSIFIKVDNWNDLIANDKLIKVKITDLPQRTSSKAEIYITGQFNGWNPAEDQYKLSKNEKGIYTIEVPIRFLRTGFKFTRGSWGKVEGDALNSYLENRFYLGKANVLELKIEGWEDRSVF